MATLHGALRAGGFVPKTFRKGTHRVRPPEETAARALRVAPAMGITRVANVTGLDVIGIPVVMVCRPNSRSLSVSQGKGLDLHSARASGLMESIEFYHAEHITLPLRLGSYEELRYTHRLIDVAKLPHTDRSQFHPDLPMLWIEGHDLLHDVAVWLPYETVSASFVPSQAAAGACFSVTSNGLASGNHLFEAISQGISEVVERDATTLAYVRDEATRQRHRLDLDTVDDPDCRAVLEKYYRADVAVAVWDQTTDVGMPTFLCRIAERSDDPIRLLITAAGMGCHPTREIALLRALTEAAQSRLTYISGSRDDCYRSNYDRLRNPDLIQRMRDQMALPAGVRLKPFRETPSWEADSFDADLAWQLERLRSVGIEEVVVVDLTKPEFGLPVVRVVIPGLEGPVEKITGYVFGARARACWRVAS